MNKYGEKRRKKSRRGDVLALLILIVLFWAFENFTFYKKTTTVSSEKLTQQIKIVALSDLHTNIYGPDNYFLKYEIEKEKPDLIFVAGDMYTSGNEKAKARAISLISALTETAPVYFVPGEHDNNDDYINELSENGVNLLLYSSEDITVNSNSITLYGIDNAYFGPNYDITREFSVDESRYNILLAHIPNSDAYKKLGADMVFCGDTHGGVVHIPFAGPLIFENRWFPRLTGCPDPITDRGLFELGNGKMYVGAGLGNYPYPLRLFNRPELSVMVLKP